MRLLPLILISGCVNWTPVEYYDIPPDRIIDSIPYELEENVKLAQLIKKSA